MKSKKYLFLLFILVMGASGNGFLFGQAVSVEIVGPTSVYHNQTDQYTVVFRDTYGNPVDPPYDGNATWMIGHPHSIVSSDRYSCSVRWDGAGTDMLEYTMDTWYDFIYGYLEINIYYAAITPPTATTAANINNNSFTANWTSVAGATGYRLDVSTDINFNSYVLQNVLVSTNSKSVTGLSAGTAYHYRVRTVGSSGTSNNSNTSSLVLPPPPPTVTTNTCGDKVLTRVGTPSGDMEWYWQFNNYEGTSMENFGPTFTATQSGNYYIRAMEYATGNWSSGTNTVVAVNPVPGAPTANNNSRCGTGTVTLTATAGTNGNTVRWYSEGTGGVRLHTGLSYTTLSLNTNTPYYISTYNTATDCESAGARIVVTAIINYVPGVPSANNDSRCGAGTITLIATAGTNGNTVHWYSAEGALLDTGLSYINPSLDITTTYYTSTYNTITGCESTGLRTPSTATINPLPINPAAPTPSPNTCGPITLTRGEPPLGFTWYWQGTNSAGTSFGNSNSTYPANISDKYYIRARNNTTLCWSGATGVPILVNPLPANPAIPSESTNACGPKTLTRDTLPSGITWYWQGTNSTGTSTSNSATTYNTTSLPGTYIYYIRARNNVTECWSAIATGKSLNVTSQPMVDAGTDLTYFIDTPAATLTGATPSGGTWSGTGISGSTFTPSMAGTGTHSVTYNYNGGNGCVGNDTRTIMVLGQPVISITSSPNYLVRGENVALTTNIYDSYQWYRNNTPISGATSKEYLATATGEYKVRIDKGSATSFSNNQRIASAIEQMSNQNYIRVNIIQQAGMINIEDLDTLTIAQTTENISYFDGLGRPKQTIMVQASPERFDVVQPVIYDRFGRDSLQFLPYSSAEKTGFYKENALDELAAFYQSEGENVANDNSPWAKTIYESSPLNRILKKGAPGTIWQPDTDLTVNDRSIKFEYMSNGSEEVYLWELDTCDNLMIADTIYYDANQLFKQVTRDEHEKKIIEYTDKQGKVILKKVQVDTIPIETAHEGWACTYYVYDDFGSLRYVLPPQMIEEIRVDLVLDQSMIDKWAFQYTYDERRRMATKKVPGAGAIYIVYDDRDRIVLTQDGNTRNPDFGGADSKWVFTKYDQLNRPIMTGFYTHTEILGQKKMQGYVNDQLEAGVYSWFETRGTIVHGYTNQSFPNAPQENQYLTVSYYDTYDFPGQSELAFSERNLIDKDGDGIADSYFQSVKGNSTGNKNKVLDATNNNWLMSVTYYDDRYRVIQTVSENLLGGNDRVSIKYDFVGKVLGELYEHVTDIETIAILKEYEYDHAGRLLRLYHKIGDSTGSKVLLAENKYNELGELIEKNIHKEPNQSDYLQSIDFRYNIRGWLKNINASDLSSDATNNNDADQPSDIFGMELIYDQGL
jgi:hypothetical protein